MPVEEGLGHDVDLERLSMDDSFASPTKRILRWIATGETGISSEALAAAYERIESRWAPSNYPHDGGDFGRCYRLLAAVPEVREGFAFLAATNEVWERLIGRWDEIAHAYLADLAHPARQVKRGRKWVWEGGGRAHALIRSIEDVEGWHGWSWRRDHAGKWRRHRWPPVADGGESRPPPLPDDATRSPQGEAKGCP